MLAALGVNITGKFAPVWSDKIEGGREQLSGSNGKGLLTDRALLVQAVAKGDRVVVAEPWCLGISPDDARGFIKALADKSVALMVGEDWHIWPGEGVEALIAAVKRQQNTTNVTAYRKRKIST